MLGQIAANLSHSLTESTSVLTIKFGSFNNLCQVILFLVSSSWSSSVRIVHKEDFPLSNKANDGIERLLWEMETLLVLYCYWSFVKSLVLIYKSDQTQHPIPKNKLQHPIPKKHVCNCVHLRSLLCIHV